MDAPIHPHLGRWCILFATMLAVYFGATALGSRGYRIWIQSKSSRGRTFSQRSGRHSSGRLRFLPLLATDPRVSAQVNGVVLISAVLGRFAAWRDS